MNRDYKSLKDFCSLPFITMPSKKQKRSAKYKRLRHFKNKLEKEGLLKEGRTVAFEPKDEVKMSEVFVEFVKPFRQDANTTEGYRKLLTLGMVAWNTSFLSEQDQKELIDKSVDGIIPPPHNETAKDIIYTLIERKNKYFHQYPRRIVSFDIVERKRDFRVAVASIL